MSTKPLHPLSAHLNLQLAVCAGGRIRDSKRLLVDIGLRSQKACDALNFFDELVDNLDEMIAAFSGDRCPEHLTQVEYECMTMEVAIDLLDRIRKCAYTE